MTSPCFTRAQWAPRLLAEDLADQLLDQRLVRRVQHLEVGAGRLAQDALVVAEGVEAGLAVVGAHTAVAHATEREVGGPPGHDRSVDAPAAARRAPAPPVAPSGRGRQNV